MKDSLEVNNKISSPRPNSHEIYKRYTHLKNNLKINSNTTDDLVNLGDNNPNQIIDDANKDNSQISKNDLKQRSDYFNKLRSKSKDSKNVVTSSTSSFTAAFGKKVTEKSTTNVLRNNFQKSLAKLNENATKEVGFSELKNMISNHSNSDSLRIYLSLLSIHYDNCTQSSKELQVLLLGYLSSVYKETLMDPLDRPANIIKSVVRITEIIQNYLKENSIVIHKACSLSLQELFDNCMPKDDSNAVILIFLDPLITLVTSGSSKISQSGAAVCLSDFILHLGKDSETLNLVSDKIINMMTKIKIDNQYVFEAFLNLLQTLPFDIFFNSLKEIYEKLISSLNNNKFSYQTKILCLKILTLLARKLKSVADIIIGYYQNEIILTLKNCTKDRVHKVQTAAYEALEEWMELERIHQEMEKKKTRLNPEMENLTKEQINNSNNSEMNKKMDKFHLLRNLSKINKSNVTENNKDPYTFLTENYKEEIYKKGIGNVLKLSNFINKKNNQDLRNSSSNNKRSVSPGDLVKEEIKDYLKKSQQVKKLNAIDEMPLEETNIYKNQAHKEIEENGDLDIENNNEGEQIDKDENNNEIENDNNNIDNIYNNDIVDENTLVNINNENESLENAGNSNFNFIDIKNSISIMFLNTYKKIDLYGKKINKKLDLLESKISLNYSKINELKKNIIQKNKQTSMAQKNKLSNHPPINSRNLSKNENQIKAKVEEKVYIEMMDKLQKQIDKSIKKEKEIENDPPIIQTWKIVLKEVENKNLNNAYNQILNSQDDIYLLRLLCLTGPVLNLLSVENSKKVLLRINMISRSHQIQSILLLLIQNSFESSIFFKLNKNDQNEILETLYEFSGINSNVGSEAANLYTKITSFY